MSAATIFTGLELLIQLLERAAAVSAVIKKARAEGRDLTAEELMQLRAQLDTSLVSLDESIERAEAEGR
jgi:hypothetical protein